MPMRRLLTVLVATLAFTGAGSFVAWRVAVGLMETRVAAWQSAQRSQGWTVTHGTPVRGGWPFAAELTLPDLALAGGADAIPGGIAWSDERVTLRVTLLRPRQATVLVGGTQHVRVGATPTATYTTDHCTLTVMLEPGDAPHAATLDAAGIRVSSGVSIGLLHGQFDTHDPATAAFAFTSTAIEFPPPPAPQLPLGRRIASASVEGSLNGGWPEAADPAAAAARWQASGGTLNLRRIALGWGPLGATGSATLALDASLRPAGSATLRLVGYEATLDLLAAGHAITPRTAQAARAVLGLIASTPEGGGAAVVEVPLTLSGRMVTMGHFPLLRLPELVWPTQTRPAMLVP